MLLTRTIICILLHLSNKLYLKANNYNNYDITTSKDYYKDFYYLLFLKKVLIIHSKIYGFQVAYQQRRVKFQLSMQA